MEYGAVSQVDLHEDLLSLNGNKKSAEVPVAVSTAEDTPSYAALQRYGLLNSEFRKDCFENIFDDTDLSSNSSRSQIFLSKMKWGVYWTPGCGLLLYKISFSEVTVPPGFVCCFIDQDNNYIFAKPGIHNILNPFIKRVSHPIDVSGTGSSMGASGILERKAWIEHGNRTIVTVQQGMLGYASDMGQPVLLPPGLHSWTSETLVFERMIELSEHVIELGPYTLLTVDEGYAAITQNNGQQVIFDGGHTHLLTHLKWRFEKFITLKIQTDDLEKIQAASADNVIMSVNSTVVWRILDVKVAATMAAETMRTSGSRNVSADISKLRRDVLKQAIASLAGFIGSVNYSDSFHVAAAAQRNIDVAVAVVEGNTRDTSDHQHSKRNDNPMFDTQGMSEAVSHANQITRKFGVEIISINIISANPVDKQLTASLSTGAVASAEALQAETKARGLAKATQIDADAMAITRRIDAESQAEATLVKAKAEADAEVLKAEGNKAAEILRAEGAKQAADLIESSSIAVTMETMKLSASAITKSDKFFFGQEPGYMSNIVMRGPESASVVD